MCGRSKHFGSSLNRSSAARCKVFPPPHSTIVALIISVIASPYPARLSRAVRSRPLSRVVPQAYTARIPSVWQELTGWPRASSFATPQLRYPSRHASRTRSKLRNKLARGSPGEEPPIPGRFSHSYLEHRYQVSRFRVLGAENCGHALTATLPLHSAGTILFWIKCEAGCRSVPGGTLANS